jgi:hypothetical protein
MVIENNANTIAHGILCEKSQYITYLTCFLIIFINNGYSSNFYTIIFFHCYTEGWMYGTSVKQSMCKKIRQIIIDFAYLSFPVGLARYRLNSKIFPDFIYSSLHYWVHHDRCAPCASSFSRPFVSGIQAHFSAQP